MDVHVQDIKVQLQESIYRRPAANGLVIIIANEFSTRIEDERLPGVRKDLEAMKETFEELKLATLPIHNASKEQVQEAIQSAAKAKYPPSYRRIAFVFAGHGDDLGRVYTHTGPVEVQKEICAPFQPIDAPGLAHMPKLFLLDTCRGNSEDRGVEIPIPRGGKKVPSYSNYLLAWSTMPTMKAFESPQGGYWAQEVARQLRTREKFVLEVLTIVNKQIIHEFESRGLMMQQPVLESTLLDTVNLRKEANELGRYPEVVLSFPPHAEEQPILAGIAPPGPLYQYQLAAHFHSPHLHCATVDQKQLPLISQDSAMAAAVTVMHPLQQIQQKPVPNPMIPHPNTERVDVSTPTTESAGTKLNHFFQQNMVRPRYEFIDNSSLSTNQSRVKCIIWSTIDGRTSKADSGGYCASKAEAIEQAAGEVLRKESALIPRALHKSETYKSKLKEYFNKKRQAETPIRYVTKQHPKGGFKSIVYAPEIGYAEGIVCKNKQEAENNAAMYALQKLSQILH